MRNVLMLLAPNKDELSQFELVTTIWASNYIDDVSILRRRNPQEKKRMV